MISFSFRKFALVAVVACLAACSYMPKIGLLDSIKPSAPPEPPKPIRSIAILGIAEPQSEQILNVGTALSSGNDTRLTQPSIENSMAYTQKLADRKTVFVPDLVRTLGTALTEDGYAVSYLPDQRAFMTPDGKSEDLTQVHSNADAILIIRFTGAGYVSSPLERSYQPWIALSARMLRNSSKEEIYFKTFSGGYQLTADSAVTLPSSSRYRYLYFHDLMSSVDQSIQGLKDSVNDIAAYLAKDLFGGARAQPLPLPPSPPATAAPANEPKP